MWVVGGGQWEGHACLPCIRGAANRVCRAVGSSKPRLTHPLPSGCCCTAVPLLSPHAAELAALVAQLVAALQALAAMVEGSVSLHR